jgi:hypothetical protein
LPAGADGTLIGYDSTQASGLNVFRIGNLLTANQASGTDTLGDTTGFAPQSAGGTLTSSTDYAYRGSRALKCVSDGVSTYQGWTTTATLPLYRYATVTVQAKVYATTQLTLRVGIFRTAAGYINSAKTVTVPAGVWTTVQHTATAGEVGAGSVTDATVFLDTGTTPQAGTFYTDDIGYWVGAGGTWTMPGTPVVGSSHIAINNAVDLSGTGVPEGVIAAPPGSAFLQTDSTTDVKGWIRWVKATGTGNTGWVAGPEADTRWRDVSGDVSGWTGVSAVKVHLRRIGGVVAWRFAWAGGGSASGSGVYATPTGFRYAALVTDFRHAMFSAAGVFEGAVNTSSGASLELTPVVGKAPRGTLTYTTIDPWPSSLPGVAV